MGVCYREIIIKSMPELKMIACHEPRIIIVVMSSCGTVKLK